MDFSSLPSLLHGLLALLYLGTVTGTGYVEKVLEHDSVCTLVNSLDVINLENGSALVVRNGPTIKRWAGQREFNCRFILTSQYGTGVFAVVQRVSFRRNAQGNCIDYIQFRHTEKTISLGDFNIKLRSPEPWSAKICGNMDLHQINDYQDYDFNGNVGDNKPIRNSFVDRRGLIEFKIHLRNKSLDDDEELNFEIVFTPFLECDRDNGIWKSCGSKTCIHEGFFDDGKLNCPYGGCKDENGCRPATALGAADGGGVFSSAASVKIAAGLSAAAAVYFAFSRLYYGRRRAGRLSQDARWAARTGTAAATPGRGAAARGCGGDGDSDNGRRSPPLYDSLFPN